VFWLLWFALVVPNVASGSENAPNPGSPSPPGSNLTENQVISREEGLGLDEVAPLDPASAKSENPAGEPGVVLIDQYGMPVPGSTPEAVHPPISVTDVKTPPVAPPAIVGFDAEQAWFRSGQRDLLLRGEEIRSQAREAGIRNLEAAARAVLIDRVSGDDVARAQVASDLAPDLPLAQMALLKALWKERGASTELGTVLSNAFGATARHLEASIWLEQLLLRVLAWALALGAVAYFLLVFIRCIPLLMHDLTDLFPFEVPMYGRALLVGFFVLLPPALGEAIIGICLFFFFVGIYYGSWNHRLVLAFASAVWLVATFGVAPIAAQRLAVLGTDSVTKRSYDASYGWLSAPDAMLLEKEARSNTSAREAYAYWLAHRGRLEEADALLDGFVASREGMIPAFLMNNAANLKRKLGRTAEAITLYTQAEEQLVRDEGSNRDRSIIAFNLASAYTESFKLAEHEQAIERAQALSEATVTELLSSSGGEIGKGVDLLPPAKFFREQLFRETHGPLPILPIEKQLLAGWSAQTSVRSILSFVIVFAIACGLSIRRQASFRCRSCGRRCCPHCQEECSCKEELCVTCARLLRKPETIDVSLRVARISELKVWNQHRARRDFFLSLFIPGFAGVVSSRPFLALVSIVTAVVIPIAWRADALGAPDPMLMGGVEQIILCAAAATAFLIYAFTLALGLSLRRYA